MGSIGNGDGADAEDDLNVYAESEEDDDKLIAFDDAELLMWWSKKLKKSLPDGSSITLLHIDFSPPWKTAWVRMRIKSKNEHLNPK